MIPIKNAQMTQIGRIIRGKFTFGEFKGTAYTAKIYFNRPSVVQFSFWSGRKNDFGKSIDMTSGTAHKNAETHYGVANSIVHQPADTILLKTILHMVGQIRCMILSSEQDIEYLEPFSKILA